MFGTRPLLWLLLLASLIGGVHWYRYERPVQHDAGALAMPEPVLATGSTLPPWTDDAGFRYLTHVHAIPSDRPIASRLSGIRPGQVVELSGLLVEVTAPSGARYTSSLALHDHDCEIAWIDGLDLVD